MNSYLGGVELPIELETSLHFNVPLHELQITGQNSTQVLYDDNGIVSQIKYYTQDGYLAKQQYYIEGNLVAIQYYMENCLYKKEYFTDEKLVKEDFYNSKGYVFKTINYHFNNDKLYAIDSSENGISKRVEFEIDLIGRIVERVVILNNKRLLHQRFRYAKNGNIEAYSDENCTIHSVIHSEDHKLLSYKLSDHNGNNIHLTNNFSRNCYLETEMLINGCVYNDKNLKYISNVYLKTPEKNIEDIDILLDEIYKNEQRKAEQHQKANEQMFSTSRSSQALTKNTEGVVDIPISSNTACPISMRKMLLYSKLLETRKQNINNNLLSAICA